jgi:iron complex outermembrane receptor protein
MTAFAFPHAAARRAHLRAGIATASLAAIAIAMAAPASAQDTSAQASQQTDPATPSGTTSIEPSSRAQATGSDTGAGSDVVVTGTLFRRTNTETPSPVTVLSADTLSRAGITTVADAVRSISADNSGSIPTAFGNGFGAGSSGVALRGLTVNSTLTLIDGLRTANYPLSDDGQRSFVDLNTVPEAIVDRVEVLKDGASSSYGADAIGGVVNIIMKKEITGINGTVEGGVTEHGDGGHQRATLTIGHGHLADDRFNVYVSGEYQHDDAIFARDRGFPFNTADLTRIGGDNNNNGSVVPGATTQAIVAPTTQQTAGNPLSGTGLVSGPFLVLNPAGCQGGTTPVTGASGSGCQQNEVHDYGLIQPAQTRWGVTGHATAQLGDTSQVYAIASYFQNDVTVAQSPASIRAINPVSTQNIVLPALLSNGALNPNDPFAGTGQAAAIRYQFGDIAASSQYKNHVLRGAAGISGRFGDGWSYSVDGTVAHSWLDITSRGYLYLPALVTAINTGSYNFINPSLNSDAVRSSLSPDNRTRATSDLDMIQGTITKDLFQLPGGALQVGVGGSFRHEAQNDPNQNPTADFLNINQYSAVGKRDVESGYFEINAPILAQLEVNGSGRYDHYSDGFSHFSPKVGVKFTPIRQVALRGTFSKGFRAPSFAELNGSVIGFTTARLPCSIQAQHGASVAADGTCSGGSQYNQSYTIGFNSAGNPNLKPELSTSFTAGTVIQPVRWFSFTVDYYNIKKTDIISSGPLANTALAAYYAGTALPTGYSVTPDVVDPNYPAGFNRALFVNSPYANAAALRTSGLDVATQFQASHKGVKLLSRFEVTKIFNYDFKPDADSPYQAYVGTQAPYVTSSGAGTPAWRGNWQNSIEYDKFSLSGTAYYTSGYKAVAIDQFGGSDCASSSTYQGSDPTFNCRTHHFVEVELTGRINVNDKFSIYSNIYNLFDAKAPLNAGNYAAANYNPTYSQSGAVGRAFRIGVDFKY